MTLVTPLHVPQVKDSIVEAMASQILSSGSPWILVYQLIQGIHPNVSTKSFCLVYRQAKISTLTK